MTDNRSNDNSRKTELDVPEEKEVDLQDLDSEQEEGPLKADEDDISVEEEAAIQSTEDELVEEVAELNALDESSEEAMRSGEENDQFVEEETVVTEHEQLVDSEAAALQAKEKEAESRESRQKKGLKKERLRLIPIWLRLVLAILLIGGSLILGIIVGYSVIGGGDPGEATHPDTWYHIIDMIRGR
ncbi:DNA-directed RNA polymerase subunit beta [Alkalihalobacillus sp. MEB130]|uniref:DNA-directed RNA polymerase subunit beta n=1 Tax=Alkalihalobacillus sp. MEB130 TaxID=2976704 RepID=UPI0028DF7C24|nr:DNA-directed RNA polymerase subunit beta [Alkalihalobacillus sp. MEB130]MDT8860413.1 DNA-directed RNA polymerase subunit beta [Alkalihalobacillus sp. MEB130]